MSGLLGPLAGTWLFGMGENLVWLCCLFSAAAAALAMLSLGPAIARRQQVAVVPAPEVG